ncbi:uncharacterized protein LOC144504729 [Mustelus asterias]
MAQGHPQVGRGPSGLGLQWMPTKGITGHVVQIAAEHPSSETDVTDGLTENNCFRKTWDPFTLKTINDEEEITGKFVLLLQYIICFIFGVCVLGFIFLSKTSLLLLISISNTHSPFENKPFIHLVLACALLVPNVLALAKALWKTTFGSSITPPLSILGMVCMIEAVVAFGTSVLVLVCMPHFDIITNLYILNGVCLLPSLLQVAFQLKPLKPSMLLPLVGFGFVFLGLLLFILAHNPQQHLDEFKHIQPYVGVAIFALIIVSFNWWENFTLYCKIGVMENIRKSLRHTRNITYVFTSAVRILVTGVVVAAWIPIKEYNWEDVKTVSQFELKIILSLFGIQAISSALCHWFGVLVCKMHAVRRSFIVPSILATPIVFFAILIVLYDGSNKYGEVATFNLTALCHTLKTSNDSDPVQILLLEIPRSLCRAPAMLNSSRVGLALLGSFAICFWLGLFFSTFYVWGRHIQRIERTSQLFVRWLYEAAFMEQSMLLNTRVQRKKEKKIKRYKPLKSDHVMIYLCATMWHETADEMAKILTSIFRGSNYLLICLLHTMHKLGCCSSAEVVTGREALSQLKSDVYPSVSCGGVASEYKHAIGCDFKTGRYIQDDYHSSQAYLPLAEKHLSHNCAQRGQGGTPIKHQQRIEALLKASEKPREAAVIKIKAHQKEPERDNPDWLNYKRNQAADRAAQLALEQEAVGELPIAVTGQTGDEINIRDLEEDTSEEEKVMMARLVPGASVVTEEEHLMGTPEDTEEDDDNEGKGEKVEVHLLDKYNPTSSKSHKDNFDFEAHVYFDDAFHLTSPEDTVQERVVNEYVKSLVCIMEDIYRTFSREKQTLKDEQEDEQMVKQTIMETPYGGRISYTLPYGSILHIHLKDKQKIRHKKRWSQIMYMYYLLGWKLNRKYITLSGKFEDEMSTENALKTEKENTYILALDGDIDFQPSALILLVDRLRRYPHVGAACGRIHPTGTGPMVWYQKFEYAVGHWLQKTAEHVLGCVLCSPGCFSLYRAAALMDDNVVKKYTTNATEGHHFVQYDQGEDRWLCTLLLQQGWRVEYNAASDAYTNAPQEFKEFYNQRRRWVSSTLANTIDLLNSGAQTSRRNPSVSKLYILYQIIGTAASILGPATVVLMIAGAFTFVFNWNGNVALALGIVPPAIYILICYKVKSDTQINIAAVLSIFYAFLMIATIMSIIGEMVKENTFITPTGLFFISMMILFVSTAMLHPQEFPLVFYGLLYIICIPSGYLLLPIYAMVNMNNVSWGTRETVTPKIQSKKKSQQVLRYEKKCKCICWDIEFVVKENKKELTQYADSVIEEEELEPRVEDNWISNLQEQSLHIQLVEEELDEAENPFWNDLINLYLKPIEEDKERQAEIVKQLKSLRNKATFLYFIINILWIISTFFLQAIGPEILIKIPKILPNGIFSEDEILTIEPLSFMFLVSFAGLLGIQFLTMLYHRINTLIHFIAYKGTEIKPHQSVGKYHQMCLCRITGTVFGGFFRVSSEMSIGVGPRAATPEGLVHQDPALVSWHEQFVLQQDYNLIRK